MFVTSKIKTIVLSLALTMAVSTVTVAQGSAAPAAGPGKIGIVNIQEAIGGCNEGKKELEALQTKFTPKQNELKTLNDEIEGLKKTYDAQQNTLSAEAKATQAKNIETKQKTLQRNYEDAQNEFQQAEQEVVNRIGGKMLTVLEKYSKANGYSVILDVSNPQTPVLWASQATVITKELVDAYNAESGVAAPAPKPGATTTNPPRPAATRPAASPAATPKKP